MVAGSTWQGRPMIYICYGVTKSASTFLYQLTEEIFSASGLGFSRSPSHGVLDLSNYYDTITPNLLDQVASAAHGRPVVLKTHGDLDPGVAARIAAGEILASASIRDPREIALSMVDHGRRARRDGEEAFSELHTVLETLPSLDAQLAVFQRWAQVKTVKVFTYNQICFDTAAVVTAVADHLGVSVDPQRVMAPFAASGMIGQFNMGVPRRYLTMDPAMQEIFLARYAAFYAAMAFEQNLPQLTSAPTFGAPRPSAGPARMVADARRLVRRLAHGVQIWRFRSR
ncbi:hypothetical protein [Azorhizobium sp. AG788]|uniref:hypothetical protein n=1 Tax=Azorhizobium sp. AG788 TaxID=2183897 RepID=UPI003138F57F